MNPIELMNLDLNKDLLSIIENKRVALVGPSPHLIDTNSGSLIDNYDVVVRMNDIVPIERLRKDYGSRTDIMFHNLGTPWMPGLKRKIDLFPEQFDNLKMIVCTSLKADHYHHDWTLANSAGHQRLINNFNSINRNNIPFHWIGHKNYMKLYGYYNCELYTGTATVSLLSAYPIKELYITGMTFHLIGDTHEEMYCEGHWDEKDLQGKPKTGWNGGFHSGGSRMQSNLLKQVIKKSDKICVDSKLREILS